MPAYKLDWELCRKVSKRVCYQAGIRRADREDFVQDVLAEMMERARRDSGGLSTKEMWRVAGRVRSRYWRIYKKARKNSSLNELVPDTTIEISETVADDKAPVDYTRLKQHLKSVVEQDECCSSTTDVMRPVEELNAQGNGIIRLIQ